MKKRNKWVRMSKVLLLFFSIFIRIYWFKLRKKSEQEWDLLWEKIGGDFRKTLFELEGLLIKVGQILSIRTDLLPHSFIKQIQDLTDKVPPSEWKEIKAVIEGEWGCELNKNLHSIEKASIASASIGEVYQAVLNNGEKVAIKVQRPQIQSIVSIDFRTLGIIIWFADRFVPVPKGFINFKVLYKELKHVIEQELDFQKEMKSLLFFKERFKTDDDVKIPHVYSDLCTSKIIVMEWVEGIRLTNDKALESLELSREELAQRILKVFLPQWLEPGIFHADPHPGNILITKDGQVILLDFGMVGEITKKDASYFQSLIGSLLAKDYSKAVECLSQLGFLHPQADFRTMEKLLAELVSFDTAALKETDLIQLKMEMNDMIQALPIQVPTRFVFLGRSVVTIEGILRQVAPEAEILELGRPVFMRWLQKQGNSKWTFLWQWAQSQPVFKVVHSVNEFLRLPQKLESIKEKEQRRHFQFVIFENNKKQFFQLLLIGLIGFCLGLYSGQSVLWQFSTAIGFISIIGYFICSFKQKKWMKYMQERK
ncbi:AarF/UbiB family protein [Metabacillus litoralis]|uniref:ABC1 kinase family protein n=1 Tax=Metabacillus litoralis TaxID=152268 RepID=UPI001B910C8A|nr:AarF/UbiB family protein [Metabacillus litoralis]UHA59124.1 AarF/UbiB family protein [Metabacillus litoralis]